MLSICIIPRCITWQPLGGPLPGGGGGGGNLWPSRNRSEVRWRCTAVARCTGTTWRAYGCASSTRLLRS